MVPKEEDCEGAGNLALECNIATPVVQVWDQEPDGRWYWEPLAITLTCMWVWSPGKNRYREATWPSNCCNIRAGEDGRRRNDTATSRKRSQQACNGKTRSRMSHTQQETSTSRNRSQTGNSDLLTQESNGERNSTGDDTTVIGKKTALGNNDKAWYLRRKTAKAQAT